MKHLLWAAALVVGTVVCCAQLHAAEQPRNLLKNPSFEQLNAAGLPQGWQVGENADKVSLDAGGLRSGVNSIQLRPEGKPVLFGQAAFVDLVPGKEYTFSAFVKTRDLSPAGTVQVQIINLGWSFSHQSRLPLPRGTNDWKRYSRTFVCPPADQFKYKGKPNTLYKALVHMNEATGTLWIDGVQLEEGNRASKFVDPDAPDKDTEKQTAPNQE